MGESAEILARSQVAPARNGDAAASARPAPPAGPLVFRPEQFFLGQTEGDGLVRNALGRVTRRCHVTTVGSASASYGAINLIETFAYDDGEVDVWRWIMVPSRDGRYVAAEAIAGSGITGEMRGGDYRLSFRRAAGRAQGVFAPRFDTCFTLLTRDTALKLARVSLFGLPVAALTAFHRRIND
jgi:hypothetical protein